MKIKTNKDIHFFLAIVGLFNKNVQKKRPGPVLRTGESKEGAARLEEYRGPIK